MRSKLIAVVSALLKALLCIIPAIALLYVFSIPPVDPDNFAYLADYDNARNKDILHAFLVLVSAAVVWFAVGFLYGTLNPMTEEEIAAYEQRKAELKAQWAAAESQAEAEWQAELEEQRRLAQQDRN
jgi:phosphotransferase system  glucose/maltose/N-acetylglucosamine-specific IIC component